MLHCHVPNYVGWCQIFSTTDIIPASFQNILLANLNWIC